MNNKTIKGMIALVAACALSVCEVTAGVGMWLPMLIGRNIQEMQKEGCKLTAEDIYNVNNASLKDAVLIFGNGCTGELVSKDGLLLTNYHCGIDAVAKLSSTTNDYLENGYTASSTFNELRCSDLTVKRLVYMQDVTSRCVNENGKIAKTYDEESGSMITVSQVIEEEASINGRYVAEVETLFGGGQYLLCVYEVFHDVRLVVAPPQCLGKFGGDTDNWMWPRQTCDFTLFRVYADSTNHASDEISKDNVPYRPLKHLKISTKGVEEGDFAMVMGYPGSTNQYKTSHNIQYCMEQAWPALIQILQARANALEKCMEKKRNVAIKYTADYSSCTNVLKKTQGLVENAKALNLVELKKQQEAEDSKSNENIKGVLKRFESIYAKKANIEKFRLSGMVNALIRWVRVFRAMDAARGGVEAEDMEQFYERFDPKTEAKMYRAMFETFFELYPQWEKDFPEMAKHKNAKNLAEALAEGTYKDTRGYAAALKADDKDMAVYQELLNMKNKLSEDLTEQHKELSRAERQYIWNLHKMQVEAGSPTGIMPDANFTMRVTYGHVEAPRTGLADVDRWYTTARQMLTKRATGNKDYRLPDDIANKLSGDYGPYAAADGELRTCFVSSLHTTGGNSGSPTLNAEGELVGLNFDRIWNGIASDYYFDKERSRNITVDIRYVLFVIDKICGGTDIVEELTQ